MPRPWPSPGRHQRRCGSRGACARPEQSSSRWMWPIRRASARPIADLSEERHGTTFGGGHGAFFFRVRCTSSPFAAVVIVVFAHHGCAYRGCAPGDTGGSADRQITPSTHEFVPQKPSNEFHSARPLPPRRVGSADTHAASHVASTFCGHARRPSWRFSLSTTPATWHAFCGQLVGYEAWVPFATNTNGRVVVSTDWRSPSRTRPASPLARHSRSSRDHSYRVVPSCWAYRTAAGRGGSAVASRTTVTPSQSDWWSKHVAPATVNPMPHSAPCAAPVGLFGKYHQ